MKIYAEIATESESELASIALNIEALVTSRLSKQNKKIFKMHIYEFMVSNIWPQKYCESPLRTRKYAKEKILNTIYKKRGIFSKKDYFLSVADKLLLESAYSFKMHGGSFCIWMIMGYIYQSFKYIITYLIFHENWLKTSGQLLSALEPKNEPETKSSSQDKTIFSNFKILEKMFLEKMIAMYTSSIELFSRKQKILQRGGEFVLIGMLSTVCLILAART